jgi:hypothetical protein
MAKLDADALKRAPPALGGLQARFGATNIDMHAPQLMLNCAWIAFRITFDTGDTREIRDPRSELGDPMQVGEHRSFRVAARNSARLLLPSPTASHRWVLLVAFNLAKPSRSKDQYGAVSLHLGAIRYFQRRHGWFLALSTRRLASCSWWRLAGILDLLVRRSKQVSARPVSLVDFA